MKTKRWQKIALAVVILAIGWNVFKPKAKTSVDKIMIVQPEVGNITLTVSTTGTVLPKNRLEVKPPVNGRVEEMMVKEGDKVKAGQTIALMSSTERAALLDAARGQGEDKLNYWKEVYKPIPLVAPIDGEVIVGTTQPGQTVTTADPVIVLSDRLIVRAQVDETDIGKIKEKQAATLSLDAYPDQKIAAIVDHIYYESKTVNNVTIYEVDLLSESVPIFFRSGMNANIEFVQEGRENVLTLPIAAIQKEKGKSFVFLKGGSAKNPKKADVVTGLSDDKNVEIVSGVTADDQVVIRTKRYRPPSQAAGGTNPFMPQRRRN